MTTAQQKYAQRFAANKRQAVGNVLNQCKAQTLAAGWCNDLITAESVANELLRQSVISESRRARRVQGMKHTDFFGIDYRLKLHKARGQNA